MPGPAFECIAEALERETYFDRLAARGTVRLALRQASLDARSITVEEMARVIDLHLPAELESRGVEDVPRVCALLKRSLEELRRLPPQGGTRSLFSGENLGISRDPEEGEGSS